MSYSKTSNFGVSKRENHNSSTFYNTKLYSDVEILEKKTVVENPFPPNYLNKITCADSQALSFLPDNSVHLIVTSPPYNVTKDYDNDLTLDDYLGLLKNVMKECYRVLVRGGRICLNIANIGRKPYIPLNSYINQLMINDLGYLMRGEIIWNKSASAGTSTAWGSWQSGSNPILRDVHEYIMIYSKEQFSRIKDTKIDSISKEDFLELTKSIWTFPTESAKKIGHPAPFPLELPRRCIEMFSFEKDVIMDPFCGSGTTCIAAHTLHRYFIGIDISPEYCELAKQRIRQETQQTSLNTYLEKDK